MRWTTSDGSSAISSSAPAVERRDLITPSPPTRHRGRRLKVHLHPHLFRNTYATRLHELGVDLLVIQGLLGHESVATTEIYTRVSAARQRQAIQALEAGNSAQ